TEETLAWQDPVTGVWLRARPDFRPDTIKTGHHLRVVSDLKFMASTFCSPTGFSRAIGNFGYHQSAAFYADGLRAVYGQYPTHWVHVVVEKPEAGVEPQHAPLSVSLYELPAEDIERGRLLNRRAINLFAKCLERDRWPAYADEEPAEVGLSNWARSQIDDATPEEYAFADASEEPAMEGIDE
ncbi:MAG: PD-(D/E)XK nuclease-like domain-containing protein, partial [Pseudomonadota bacterium]